MYVGKFRFYFLACQCTTKMPCTILSTSSHTTKMSYDRVLKIVFKWCKKNIFLCLHHLFNLTVDFYILSCKSNMGKNKTIGYV